MYGSIRAQQASKDQGAFLIDEVSRTDRKRCVLLTVLPLCVTTAIIVCFGKEEVPAMQYVPKPLLSFSNKKLYAQREAQESFYSNFGSMDLPAKKKKKKKKKLLEEITAPEGCEGTVMIVRHCEKSDIKEHCSYVGFERSVYLATLFGDDDKDRWPAPSYIFALNPGGRKHKKKRNYRELETVQPLAEKFNITVNDSFKESEVSSLAKHIQNMFIMGEMCGKVAIICWKHNLIPHVAHKLGCGPTDGCPLDYPGSDFDQVWQIKFAYERLWHSVRRNGEIPKADRWMLFGSVQNQGFDPLSFSKQYGDYKDGGRKHGARWKPEALEVTEAGPSPME
mmetsp:Transcript_29539/g.41348  ORF Transcript_29539/g.41348 Transcript_29539/m.41348 type:complete len:336 (-) Transcript_29539:196-1203(-)